MDMAEAHASQTIKPVIFNDTKLLFISLELVITTKYVYTKLRQK